MDNEFIKRAIKKFIKYLIIYLIIYIIFIIFFILTIEGTFVNKNSLENQDFSTKLNLYILENGNLKVEQNIKLNSNEYSTNLDSKLHDHYSQIQDIKVYYNNKQLTSNYDRNGYFEYETHNKNLKSFLPQDNGDLKIIYQITDYITKYSDINYLELYLKYGYNIFDDSVQINIIMPKVTSNFLINTNTQFENRSIIKSLNDRVKQISLKGLKELSILSCNFNLKVLFDKEIISDNTLIFSTRPHQYEKGYNKLLNEFNQNKTVSYENYYYFIFVSIIFFTPLSALGSVLYEYRRRIYKYNKILK